MSKSTKPVRRRAGKIPPKPPTTAEMLRVVRVWLKARRPAAKDVEIIINNPWGASEETVPVSTPPAGWAESIRGLVHDALHGKPIPDGPFAEAARKYTEETRKQLAEDLAKGGA